MNEKEIEGLRAQFVDACIEILDPALAQCNYLLSGIDVFKTSIERVQRQLDELKESLEQ